MVSTEEMADRTGNVAILHRISGIVSSERSLDEMLHEIVELAAGVTGCDACLVYLVDSASEEFALRASLLPHAEDLGLLRVKPGEGVTGWVAEHMSPVALSSKAAADPRFKMFPALVEDTYEVFLSVPVISGGKAIGVAVADSPTGLFKDARGCEIGRASCRERV